MDKDSLRIIDSYATQVADFTFTYIQQLDDVGCRCSSIHRYWRYFRQYFTYLNFALNQYFALFFYSSNQKKSC